MTLRGNWRACIEIVDETRHAADLAAHFELDDAHLLVKVGRLAMSVHNEVILSPII